MEKITQFVYFRFSVNEVHVLEVDDPSNSEDGITWTIYEPGEKENEG